MTYTVTITNQVQHTTYTVEVEGDGFRDAAVMAAETPFELWTWVAGLR